MSFYGREAGGSTPVDAWQDERWVLTSEPGESLLAQIVTIPKPLPADLMRWRRLAEPRRVAAAIRLIECRRRGEAKFARAGAMWLDPVGLEQATSEIVARHKAERFEAPLVVDLCSGVGGDALALARRASVLAVDLDPGMCRRLAWNARVHELGTRVLPCRARAESFPIPSGAWVHVDPDRRAGNRQRARRLENYSPGLGFLTGLLRSVPGGAIKLSPASDFAAHFEDPRCEIELISLNGECKEATVWFGAAAGCRRRATRLPEGVTWTDRDGDPTACARAVPVGSYVYDPDAALIRAGLLDAFAVAHDLSRIHPSCEYLTSDAPVWSAFLSAHEVQEVLPLDLKRLRRWAGDHAIGCLEVKVRGLDVTPEQVRAAVRPAGDRSATLILCGGTGRALAIVTRPLRLLGS